MPDAQHLHAKLLEGVAHQQAGRLAEAGTAYRFVLKHDPRNFDALHLLGVIAAETKEFTEAVKLISRALIINPANATAHYNRGIALEELRQYDAAVAAYDKCIKLKPDHAVAYNNRGIALAALRRLNEAVASSTHAIALQPDYADAFHNRGLVRSDLGEHEAALADFDAALRLKSGYPFLTGVRLQTKLRICDWHNVAAEIADVENRLARNEAVTTPWPALAITGSPALQRKAAETWAQANQPPNPALGPLAARARRGKIRIGYFSMDFREHPVAQLIAGFIEQHDRGAFEIYAFSYSPDTKDALRQRLRGAVDTFIDVREKSDPDIAALARKAGIDIAVDLAGYTTAARPGIMAARAAPLQVNYLGYAASMGVPYIDYVIADPHVLPDAHKPHFSEKVVTLPCYMVNDSGVIASATRSRASFGLPAAGFVFCCFNNAYKIRPETFDAWMGILQHVPGSVLWLLEDNAAATRNLRREASLRGIDPARLVFAARGSAEDYRERLRIADVYLDTSPYNAHTAAGDALGAGLPLITCQGESFAGRVAASLLQAAGTPDLITHTLAEYESLAVDLATAPDRLAAVKHRLAENREHGLLYDTARFARHMEAAYIQMVERQDAGLSPDHLQIT